MKFMTIVKANEKSGVPPRALFDAIDVGSARLVQTLLAFRSWAEEGSEQANLVGT